MTLKDLFNLHGQIDWREQEKNFQPTALVSDSREVSKGSIFVAVRGTQVDGHQFLNSVATKEPSALVVESLSNVPASYKGAVFLVLDTRMILPVLAERFYQAPATNLSSLAVTGTNGKTSVTYIVEHLLNKQQQDCGVIGTIDHHIRQKKWSTHLTSPDPITFQKRLHDFVEEGAKSFIVEASSHALKQKRILQSFNGVIFTNLSRDHLDYHPNMDDYFSSKALLFAEPFLKENSDNFAVINNDDVYGKKLIELTQGRIIYRYGQSSTDFTISEIVESLSGTLFNLKVPNGEILSVKIPLVGTHNVYNVVAALVTIHGLGLSLKQAVEDLQTFSGIPGRLQSVISQKGLFGFVDYAHTPDALEKVLSSLKKLKAPQARLICVFGCGGDRDQGKRVLMGAVSRQWSDFSVVTTDNPRNEDPKEIITQIMAAFEDQGPPAEDGIQNVVVEDDREKAIQLACYQSKPGDVILVAGKGHENYQIVGKDKRDFDDYKMLEKYLR